MAQDLLPKKLVRVGPSIVQQLQALRREFEQDGAQLHCLEVNAAVWLDDAMLALGLSDSARRAVLGQRSAAFVEELKNTPVRGNGKGGHRGSSRPARG